MVKGFAQKKGIYFDEIFSPIVKMTSIRTILSPVAIEYLHLKQLDVKTTFLHGDLEEEIYMEHPQGYEVKGKDNLVCILKNNLYGLVVGATEPMLFSHGSPISHAKVT